VSRFRAICRPIHHGEVCWRDTFDSFDEACKALENHIEEERSSGEHWSHSGRNEGSIVELVDEKTAKIAARHDYKGPSEESVDFAEEDDKPELRRSPQDQKDVGELVERGDKIEVEYSEDYVSKGKVYKVLERQKYGIQVFSIIFVPVDSQPNDDWTYPDDDKKFLNNLLVQDGEIKYLFQHRDDPITVGEKVSGTQLGLQGFARGENHQ